mgnify:FL=1
MKTKILIFCLFILGFSFYLNDYNIKISADTLPPYCNIEREKVKTGGIYYEYGEPSITGTTIAYDRDLTGQPVQVEMLGYKVQPYTETTYRVCRDLIEKIIISREVLSTLEGADKIAFPMTGTGNWRVSSGSKSYGQINYFERVGVVSGPGLHHAVTVDVTAVSYWVTSVSVSASSDIYEGFGNLPTATCRKYYGRAGTSAGCSASSSTQNYNGYRLYTFSYTDPHTGVRGSDTARVWFFKEVELSVSGQDKIVVDAVRGYSASDLPIENSL